MDVLFQGTAVDLSLQQLIWQDIQSLIPTYPRLTYTRTNECPARVLLTVPVPVSVSGYQQEVVATMALPSNFPYAPPACRVKSPFAISTPYIGPDGAVLPGLFAKIPPRSTLAHYVRAIGDACAAGGLGLAPPTADPIQACLSDIDAVVQEANTELKMLYNAQVKQEGLEHLAQFINSLGGQAGGDPRAPRPDAAGIDQATRIEAEEHASNEVMSALTEAFAKEKIPQRFFIEQMQTMARDHFNKFVWPRLEQ
jgi:hypothetical protein